MDIKDMTMEQVEARAEEIREALTAEDADLEALNAEADQLAERRAAIIAEQRDAMKAVAAGAGKLIEEREEKDTMTIKEVRESKEYLNAYANYMKTNDDTECRMLISENAGLVEGSRVPVPVFVENIVAESLKASKIIDRASVIEAKGNVKVPVEISAPMAAVHPEGTAAITEEALELAMVEITPMTAKKLVRFTDEVLDNMNGEAFLRYLYDEVARGVRKFVETTGINFIMSGTGQEAEVITGVIPEGDPAIGDIVALRALIQSDAEDLVVITDPATYAAYKQLAMNAHYAVDPFDGLEVIITNNMPIVGGDSFIIVGDLKGLMFNFPIGREVEMKYDDKTEMSADVVRLLGRLPFGVGLVGNHYFAAKTITNEDSGDDGTHD